MRSPAAAAAKIPTVALPATMEPPHPPVDPPLSFESVEDGVEVDEDAGFDSLLLSLLVEEGSSEDDTGGSTFFSLTTNVITNGVALLPAASVALYVNV